MSCLEVLGTLANVASIVTAVVAAWVALYYWHDRCAKQKRLEQYLKAEHEKSNALAHTIVHLMAKLGMTEAEILRASFASPHIVHKIRKDYETGLAAQLLFEYSDVAKP